MPTLKILDTVAFLQILRNAIGDNALNAFINLDVMSGLQQSFEALKNLGVKGERFKQIVSVAVATGAAKMVLSAVNARKTFKMGNFEVVV